MATGRFRAARDLLWKPGQEQHKLTCVWKGHPKALCHLTSSDTHWLLVGGQVTTQN